SRRRTLVATIVSVAMSYGIRASNLALSGLSGLRGSLSMMKPWPSGALAMAWIPAQDVGGDDRQRSDELRYSRQQFGPQRPERVT
ncbi:hypothetical protein C7D72_29440, partial [Klebsiella pneumoniae]